MSRVQMLDKCKRDGYIVTVEGGLEHRSVYTETHGAIPEGWVIHHIDHVKHNNDLDNLIALPERFHSYIHVQMQQEGRKWSRGETERALAAYQGRVSRVPAKLVEVRARIDDLQKRLLDLQKIEQGLQDELCEGRPIPVADGRWRQYQDRKAAKGGRKRRNKR